MIGLLDTMPAGRPTTDPEVPPAQQWRNTSMAAQRQEEETCCRKAASPIICLMLTAASVFFVLFVVMDLSFYCVKIDSVSGLDAETRAGLHVEFNVTIHVDASFNAMHNACLKPSAYVEVSYRGVTLAATPPLKVREYQALAKGVAVPGAVLDTLVADVRSGFPVQFDPILHA